MATATKKSRAAEQLARHAAAGVGAATALEFRIFEDNGGAYHWTIVGGGGATVAQSEGFATYDDAERAAQHVRNGAATALFERVADDDRPADLITRRSDANGQSDAVRTGSRS